jgi:hypothetical protein
MQHRIATRNYAGSNTAYHSKFGIEEMVEIQRTKIAKAMKHLMANPSKEENIPMDNDVQVIYLCYYMTYF